MAQQPSSSDPKDADRPNAEPADGGLPLPDPYPDYVVCQNCGELEVEIWSYETETRCHSCGSVVRRQPPARSDTERRKLVRKKR